MRPHAVILLAIWLLLSLAQFRAGDMPCFGTKSSSRELSLFDRALIARMLPDGPAAGWRKDARPGGLLLHRR